MWYIKGEQHEVRTSSGICDCSGKLNLFLTIMTLFGDFPNFRKMKMRYRAKASPRSIFIIIIIHSESTFISLFNQYPACGNISQ